MWILFTPFDRLFVVSFKESREMLALRIDEC